MGRAVLTSSSALESPATLGYSAISPMDKAALNMDMIYLQGRSMIVLFGKAQKHFAFQIVVVVIIFILKIFIITDFY